MRVNGIIIFFFGCIGVRGVSIAIEMVRDDGNKQKKKYRTSQENSSN